MRARPLGSKLYLEGVEVPFLGATITSQVGTASIAYIDVVPHAQINHVKPRTHVMLAVRDYHNKSEGFPYVKAWEGEVFGYSFSKTPQSRSMTLSCIDFTSYWDNVLTYYFNPQTSLGNGGMNLLPVGMDADTASKMGINITALPTNLETYFYTKMKEVVDNKGDILEAIVHLIEKVAEVNTFYKGAESRVKINSRIMIKSSQALLELLPQSAALAWFNRIASEDGGFQSLRHTILNLMSILFHDQVTVPFPAKAGGKFLEYVFKPNMFMISPPACNVFFPDEYSSFNFSRNFFLEPTRLMYCPEITTPSGEGVALPRAYAPENLQRFIFGPKYAQEVLGKADFTETGDFGAPKNSGKYGEALSGNELSQFKREQHFLTNEEKFKGILLAKEEMVPASNEFKAYLSDDQRGKFSQRIAQYMLIKKRYQTRELQVTSHLKLSVVPGFSALILDDSPAGQSMVAYVSSVTHRIYATEGGYTNVSLSYARTVTEQEDSSENKNDPLIPPWFEKTIFGSREPIKATTAEANTLAEDTPAAGKGYVAGVGLPEYYASLLGPKGSKPVTSAVDGKGMYNAVAAYLGEYRKRKNSGEDVLDYIAEVTDRSYVKIQDAFAFIGAKMAKLDLTQLQFSEAVGDTFPVKTSTKAGTTTNTTTAGTTTADTTTSNEPLDKDQRIARGQVVRRYRDKLKQGRGFRG